MRRVDGHPSYKTRLFPHLVYNSNGYSTYVAVVKIETLRIHVKHIKNRLHARNMDDESGWKILYRDNHQPRHPYRPATSSTISRQLSRLRRKLFPSTINSHHHRRPHYLKRFIRPLSFFPRIARLQRAGAIAQHCHAYEKKCFVVVASAVYTRGIKKRTQRSVALQRIARKCDNLKASI